MKFLPIHGPCSKHFEHLYAVRMKYRLHTIYMRLVQKCKNITDRIFGSDRYYYYKYFFFQCKYNIRISRTFVIVCCTSQWRHVRHLKGIHRRRQVGAFQVFIFIIRSARICTSHVDKYHWCNCSEQCQVGSSVVHRRICSPRPITTRAHYILL